MGVSPSTKDHQWRNWRKWPRQGDRTTGRFQGHRRLRCRGHQRTRHRSGAARADVRRRGGQVGQTPAVIDATGTTLTYGQLDERSSRLARWLIARGIGAESLVALAIGRSAALLTAIWAVAKTGAGYVPIDPDYPADRVANMVEDSGAILGLTAGDTGDLPGDEFAWVRIDDPAVAGEIDGCDAAPVASEELVRPVRTDNVAYVIYTSGSTGRPKGVSVTHSGLANFAAEEIERAGVDRYSRVLGFASPSFDASVLEYLMATRSGSVLVYRPSDAVGGEVLQEYMARQGITHLPHADRALDARPGGAVRVAGGVRRRRGGQRGTQGRMGGLPSYPEPVRPHRNHHRCGDQRADGDWGAGQPRRSHRGRGTHGPRQQAAAGAGRCDRRVVRRRPGSRAATSTGPD